MGIRRQLALDVGGFRTDLGWGNRMIPSEEIDFFKRVRDTRRGYIEYLAEAVVEHRIDPEKTEYDYYLKWQQAYGKSLVLMEELPEKLSEYIERISDLRKVVSENKKAMKTKGSELETIEHIREIERAKGGVLELIRLYLENSGSKYLNRLSKHKRLQ